MPSLTIDDIPVRVPDGATILDAAEAAGVHIPTMCFRRGLEPQTSCFVCVVKIAGREAYAPACATRCEEGMVVWSECEEIQAARRTALELLLSDHLGDCIAPCQTACPAGMDIPRMIRHLRAGESREAIEVVKRDIALPAVLGRICPAPCEKACRRGRRDQPISIMLLKRRAADVDLASDSPYQPETPSPSGRRVAVVGAGPAGLAAAYYLRRAAHACTIYDDHDAAGGMLRYGVPESDLPRDVLDAEIATITSLGVELRLGATVGRDVAFDDLRRQFDAVLLAVGDRSEAGETFGLDAGENGFRVDRETLAASEPGVFAAGDAVRVRRLTVRAVADGKAAAASIDQLLSGREMQGEPRPWTCRIGRMEESELEAMVSAEATTAPRVEPLDASAGLSAGECVTESARCLHCDCRKPDACRLRKYAAACGASATRHRSGDRRAWTQHRHPQVIYEPGKCIDCGLCIQIADRAHERPGLAFIGRGFDVRVAVPFGGELSEALQRVAGECADACPTGALSRPAD